MISADWCGPCQTTIANAAGLPVREVDHLSPLAVRLWGGVVPTLPTVVLVKDGYAGTYRTGLLTRADWLRLAAEQGVRVSSSSMSRLPVSPALLMPGGNR